MTDLKLIVLHDILSAGEDLYRLLEEVKEARSRGAAQGPALRKLPAAKRPKAREPWG